MRAAVVYHYSVDDPKFTGDYYEIELFMEGSCVATWGDDYHDKGREKLAGFIQGVEWAKGEKVYIERINMADKNY